MKKIGLVMILFFSAVLHGQDEPRVRLRTRFDPAGSVLVGQPVRFHVDVLVTTWLTRAPIFPKLEIDGALVIFPEERARNLSDRFEGQSWFGVSRSYIIYPQKPGEFQIPTSEVVVTYGQADEPARLSLEPVAFRATIPAQARGLGYFFATTDFQLTHRLEPKDLSNLKVGDSIHRTVQITADKTFSMFLPPVEFEPVDGLAVYPDPPKLEDRSDDRIGFLGGSRSDSASYVIEKEGNFYLPPLSVFWWDLEADGMREAKIPAVEFSAAANPGYASEIPLPLDDEGEFPEEKEVNRIDQIKEAWIPLLLSALFLVLLIHYMLRFVKFSQKKRRERQFRYLQSEEAFFDRLKMEARKGEASNLILHLYQWMDRFSTGEQINTLEDLEGFDKKLGETLSAAIKNRYSAKPSQETSPGSNSEIIQMLYRFRKCRSEARKGEPSDWIQLPELNP